jgi:hypothetical protein
MKSCQPTSHAQHERCDPAVVDRGYHATRPGYRAFGNYKHRGIRSPRDAFDYVGLTNANAIRGGAAAEHEQRRFCIGGHGGQGARRPANPNDASRGRNIECGREAPEPTRNRRCQSPKGFVVGVGKPV